MGVQIGTVRFPYATFCANGAQSFFGQGYWYDKYFRLLGLTYENTNLATKTATRERRLGNMILGEDGISPEELMPSCIQVHWRSGHVLNADGLSGPGIEDLLQRGLWQKLEQPFSISVIAVSKSRTERMEEYRQISDLILHHIEEFRSQFVIQLNYGCPNSGIRVDDLFGEIADALGIMQRVGVPLMLNFNPLVSAELLLKIEETGRCNGFWIANSVGYYYHGLGQSIFGSEVSPMEKRGFSSAGGVSGPEYLRFTVSTIEKARDAGVTLPIVGGNGIRTPQDVLKLKSAGANGIAIGSIGMVPPWTLRMRAVIEMANNVMGN